MKPSKTEVFISYGREDLFFVQKLVDYLNSLNIKTWFDVYDLLPGERWEEAIEDEIKTTKILLLIISRKSSERRGFIHKEQHYAIETAKFIPGGQIYIIPTMLGECDIPRHLKQYHIANLAEEDGIIKLIKSLEIGLCKSFEISDLKINDLKNVLQEHLGLDALNSTKLKNMFLQSDELSIQHSLSIIQRIANSRDINRKTLLTELGTLNDLSFAEEEALNYAIDAIEKNTNIDNLFIQITQLEKDRILKMGILGNEKLTNELQLNKYVRYISRKNTEAYKMAQKRVLEILGS
ncbi:toll/interleukin-1 receptor domain-containing protein [Chryseobacterium sp. Tr-659]|uniref:toll/interleukin-1 receptor domain-containing protein n=1 Tax=Chryseobacterium sp. Tr-659 TaxID=2608340 RepID=UPI00141F0CA6|nr:toll/interleukin-1 receptor domain-containing protein [Chryseobacterium sp. Tr-659]NIF03964.1 toll/interleukin-1 receptor domain-containing protein [Chryseobacterium sp. Tr-659]